MRELGRLLFLMAPVVVAGILHMVLIKKGVLASWARPIDGGKVWRGARVFGETKTWRGVALMTGLTLLAYLASHLAATQTGWGRALAYYDYGAVSPVFAGVALGLGYILAELPNSFLKRRLGIGAGRSGGGWKRWVFGLVDQGDSVLGCLLAMTLYWELPGGVFWRALLLGTLVHLGCNGLLHLARMKGRPGETSVEGEA